jgi:hypothetical protein
MFSYPGTRTSTSTRTPALSFLRPGNRTRFSLLLLACLIDAADKSLLAATFKAFETTLQVLPHSLTHSLTHYLTTSLTHYFTTSPLHS